MTAGLVAELATVPLLIIDDLGMRKLAHTAAEDLLELIMRRYERASTLLEKMAPRAGLEPATLRLTAAIPMINLVRRIVIKIRPLNHLAIGQPNRCG